MRTCVDSIVIKLNNKNNNFAKKKKRIIIQFHHHLFPVLVINFSNGITISCTKKGRKRMETKGRVEGERTKNRGNEQAKAITSQKL
jgi:hypothetical protein